MNKRHANRALLLAICSAIGLSAALVHSANRSAPGLWAVYEQSLKGARYIDLTHTLTPAIPVWKGFGPSRFGPSVNPETGQPYDYAKDGFEATHYDLSTDQFGTQLDPPAHWAPEYPAIDELPATYAVRPLVVVSIAAQVAKDPGYHLEVEDIDRWEAQYGRIPAGSVVMVRSDWSKRCPTLHSRPRPCFRVSRSPHSSFCTSNVASCSMVTSRSIPTRLRRSKAKAG
jgi:hypothetical protein